MGYYVKSIGVRIENTFKRITYFVLKNQTTLYIGMSLIKIRHIKTKNPVCYLSSAFTPPTSKFTYPKIRKPFLIQY